MFLIFLRFLCIVAGELDRDIFDKIIFNYLDIL